MIKNDSQLFVRMYPSGYLIDLLDFGIPDVNAYDIVFGLSRINRYNGQTPEPWDVLSHSRMTLEICIDNFVGAPDHTQVLMVLLHDAAEAYLGDIVAPLKRQKLVLTEAGYSLADLEKDIRDRIYRAFGLQYTETLEERLYKERYVELYDKQALAIEYWHFFPELREIQHKNFANKTNDFAVPTFTWEMEHVPALIKATPIKILEGLKELTKILGMPDDERAYLFQEPRLSMKEFEDA